MYQHRSIAEPPLNLRYVEMYQHHINSYIYIYIFSTFYFYNTNHAHPIEDLFCLYIIIR